MADWLRIAIMDGLKGLLALRLDNAPAAGTIKKTADIWENAIGQRVSVEHLDAPRIEAAFQSLFSAVRKWPVPAQLIELMPSRKRVPELPHLLTEEQRQQNIQRSREMLRKLMEEM